jgi:hypothetical protein
MTILCFAAAALLAVTAGAPPQPAPAQTPGAAPAIAGTWTFDPYVSDHPEQIALALRLDTGDGFGARGRGNDSGDDNGGNPSAGRRPELGRGRGAGMHGPAMSEADRTLLTELTDAVRFPPLRLAITASDAGLRFDTGPGEPALVHPDGKPEKRQLRNGVVTRTARRDGSRLVVSDEVGQAGTLTHTYEVAPTTGQLVVRVAFTPATGEASPLEIKLVYDNH